MCGCMPNTTAEEGHPGQFCVGSIKGNGWWIRFSRNLTPEEQARYGPRIDDEAWNRATQNWDMDKVIAVVKDIAPDIEVVASQST